jgi:aminomethyltransferase
MSLARIYSRLSPKMGPYGEYFLPMTFSKFRTKDVVLNTRKPGFATVFDVSHMGIFETYNKKILEDTFLVNLNKLKNKSKLCGLLDSRGYILDDIIVGNVDESKFRMVVNSNTKDIYRRNHSFIEREKSILAIQGDQSQKIVEELFNVNLDDMYFMDNKTVIPNEIELCRCGYTGEDGFEIYLKPQIGDEIRYKLVDLSLENDNIMFGGLVERDLLRLESGLCLSGVEFGGDMDIDFKALGMDFMVGLKHRKDRNFSSDYIRSGFLGIRPIKKGKIVDQQGEEVGIVTSSNKSFNLNKFIGMGYIRKDRIDNKLEGIERVDLPFIESNYKRI